MDYDISFLRSTLNKGLSKYQTCLMAFVDKGWIGKGRFGDIISYSISLFTAMKNNSMAMDNTKRERPFSVSLSQFILRNKEL